MTRVLVAMSGGVDSSVAAALMLREGHEVVGATMKLWGGPSDTGCCSVADVEDARRVCQQLGIDHHVFNFTAEFERDVVAPYVTGHQQARTPNPCVACNANLKFDRFLQRARLAGFDAIATGHHARISKAGGKRQLLRGRDMAKDQSYVLYMLGQQQLSELMLPIGDLTKQEVRDLAGELGLRTASKPDSQDVCFISRAAGRGGFLASRMALSGGHLVTTEGEQLGDVESLELLTVGQRRGLGLAAASAPERRYVVGVDLDAGTATVGSLEDLLVKSVVVGNLSWASLPIAPGSAVQVQLSAHGQPLPATWLGMREPGSAKRAPSGRVALAQAARRPAPGQAVVFYEARPCGDAVLGGGIAL